MELKTDNLYKWGFYNNPDDLRLFVPKRIASLGFTINIGRPAGRVIAIAMTAVIGLTIAAVIAMITLGFNTKLDQELKFSALFYGTTIKQEEVESITLSNEALIGMRTNGISTPNKSIGYFNYNHYGACRVFLYNDLRDKIVIKLSGQQKYSYVFVNESSEEKTQELFGKLKAWMNEKN